VVHAAIRATISLARQNTREVTIDGVIDIEVLAVHLEFESELRIHVVRKDDSSPELLGITGCP
jgi:hypothetical protein